jgi:hypothetical protein
MPPTLEELEHDPRPMSADEAARLLSLTPGQFAALNLPVTRTIDGVDVFVSNEVIYWLRLRQVDPDQFERRIAAYHGELGHP